MSPVLLTALVSALALVLTAVLTPLVRGAAIAGGMVRQARDDRWHTRPTPAIGGVAIYLGFGLALGVGYVLSPDTLQAFASRPATAVLPWAPWEGLLAAGTVAFLVGLVDDFARLSPIPKLAGQLAAAAVLVLSGIGVWFTGVYAVDALLSLFWFVAITNAMNLLDNMDGLAAGTAAIAGAYLAVIFFLDGETELVILALAFSSALVGFLAHNYPPARIFMGDSGSLFLGLFLAGLALAPAPGLSRSLAAVMAAPVLILAIPILDTTLVTIGRVLEGRPVSQGGRDHTSHRIVDLGLPERRTVWLLWGLAAVGGAVGVLLRTAERGTAVLLGGVLVGMLTLVGAYLLSIRFRSMAEDEVADVPLYRLLVSAHERYPVFSFLLDGIWIGLAYYAAYLLRWDPGQLDAELAYFQQTVAVVIAAKLIAFAAAGVYGPRWEQFGLYDALRVGRANVLGTLLAAVLLLLIQRVGLSRGVVALDLLVCTVLTVGSRMSFRLIEGTTRRWSDEGEPVVVLGSFTDAELAIRELEHTREPQLRVVGIAAPDFGRKKSRMGAHPMFGGPEALSHALSATGAAGVVLVERAGRGVTTLEVLRRHLESEGGVDVWRLRVEVVPESVGALEPERNDSSR